MLAYVVRHAESRSNTGEYSGLDSELTDLGRSQAEALAGRFGDLSIDTLYSSPFRRSLQTARPIADALGVSPHTTPCTSQRVWELLRPDEALVPYDFRLKHAPERTRMAR